MFGLSRAKKPEPEKKPRSRDLTQFGLFDVPTDLGGSIDDGNDADSDLEAELAAITAGSSRPRPAPKKPAVAAADLDRMVAESMRDDANEDDDDDVDENDPDLLSELHGLTGATDVEDDEQLLPADTTPKTPSALAPKSAEPNIVDLLTGRLELYRIAEDNAKAAGDAGKARRIGRGLKTLADQLRQAKAGRPINVEDIPPEVTTKAAAAAPAAPAPPVLPAPPTPELVPTRAAPQPPPAAPVMEQPQSAATPVPAAVTVDEEALRLLNARKREFQVAALAAKKAGDRDTAMQHIRVLKQFDLVIAEAAAGRPVDLSAMPTVPGARAASPARPPAAAAGREEAEHQQEAPAAAAAETPADAVADPVAPDAPSAPATVAEALQQRLDKYQSVELAAKAEGNTSKARRYGRIIKQYQDAIKLHRSGRPVAFDELPTPPGFGPIPGVAAPAPDTDEPAVATPAAPAVPTVAAGDAPAQPTPPPPVAARKPPAPPAPLPAGRLSGNHSSTALMQQTIQTLAQRQAEFRRAAVAAKQAGNLPQAKEYLRQHKQLEQLLEVARGGMPVDLGTVPLGPAEQARLEDTFDMVSESDCAADEAGGLGNIGARLEQQLLQQLAQCKQTRDHHRAMGDVAGTNRFENLAMAVQRDCDILRLARAQNAPVPKFHYERKRFDIVRCNTDLADSELEITVCRGIGYGVPNPKEVDTYVRLEVPLPSAEQPFRARTQLVRDTNGPVYDEKFMVEMAPKQRACQRVFKRHALKLEVFSKGNDWWLGRLWDRLTSLCCYSGFLRSDTLIGTVTVKLQPLETVCELHDSFDLMDGRKANGGKLEVKIRSRNPILTTQIVHSEEQWLHIDS